MFRRERRLALICAALLGSLVGGHSASAATCVVNGVAYTVTKTGAGTINGTGGNDVILGSAGGGHDQGI